MTVRPDTPEAPGRNNIKFPWSAVAKLQFTAPSSFQHLVCYTTATPGPVDTLQIKTQDCRKRRMLLEAWIQGPGTPSHGLMPLLWNPVSSTAWRRRPGSRAVPAWRWSSSGVACREAARRHPSLGEFRHSPGVPVCRWEPPSHGRGAGTPGLTQGGSRSQGTRRVPADIGRGGSAGALDDGNRAGPQKRGGGMFGRRVRGSQGPGPTSARGSSSWDPSRRASESGSRARRSDGWFQFPPCSAASVATSGTARHIRVGRRVMVPRWCLGGHGHGQPPGTGQRSTTSGHGQPVIVATVNR